MPYLALRPHLIALLALRPHLLTQDRYLLCVTNLTNLTAVIYQTYVSL